jgi:hypothetical protein
MAQVPSFLVASFGTVPLAAYVSISTAWSATDPKRPPNGAARFADEADTSTSEMASTARRRVRSKSRYRAR